MSKKKEDPCPLKPSEWIQCLIDDQNKMREICYSEELSLFTKTIILLTIINCLLVLLSIFNNFGFIVEELKIVFFVTTILILVYLIITSFTYIRRLKDAKAAFQINVITKEDEIIEEIIDGKLKDSNEIRKRYKEL